MTCAVSAGSIHFCTPPALAHRQDTMPALGEHQEGTKSKAGQKAPAGSCQGRGLENTNNPVDDLQSLLLFGLFEVSSPLNPNIELV